MRDVKQLTVDKVKRRSHPCKSVEQLRQEYLQQLKGEVNILDQHNQQLNSEAKSNAQQYLEQNYPLETRSTIKGLNISNKNLKGSLDLKDFINLEQLSCSGNQLTSLDFSANSAL